MELLEAVLRALFTMLGISAGYVFFETIYGRALRKRGEARGRALLLLLYGSHPIRVYKLQMYGTLKEVPVESIPKKLIERIQQEMLKQPEFIPKESIETLRQKVSIKVEPIYGIRVRDLVIMNLVVFTMFMILFLLFG